MLPAANRLRRSSDFRSVVSGGRRVRRGAVVVHHLATLRPPAPALVGFVVGRPVGASVTRHRVTRRLRALVASRITVLPEGSGTVVRALPASAAATSASLGSDLDAALAGALTGASR